MKNNELTLKYVNNRIWEITTTPRFGQQNIVEVVRNLKCVGNLDRVRINAGIYGDGWFDIRELNLKELKILKKWLEDETNE